MSLANEDSWKHLKTIENNCFRSLTIACDCFHLQAVKLDRLNKEKKLSSPGFGIMNSLQNESLLF